MNYKEFYHWIDGFLTARTDIREKDILHIKEVMEKVKDEKESLLDSVRKNGLDNIYKVNGIDPIYIKTKEDDLGKPPKIVM